MSYEAKYKKQILTEKILAYLTFELFASGLIFRATYSLDLYLFD